MIDFDAFAGEVTSSDLGTDAVYTPEGESGVAIHVVMDTEYSAPDGVGLVGVSSSAPVATCKASDVSSAARGDSLAVGAVTYTITEVMPNGDGFTVLRLSRD